jgi:hypothetical protein
MQFLPASTLNHSAAALLMMLLTTVLCMLLQSGMARLPGDPALLVMYANFLIVHKNGQAARTQMQMAQRAHPSLLCMYNIYVAKQLKRGGGLTEFKQCARWLHGMASNSRSLCASLAAAACFVF